MANKISLKQRMIEKLYAEHGIDLDPLDLVSWRRCGFGSRVVSWSTLRGRPVYQSFETMRNCLKYPTKLVRHGWPPEPETTIEIDYDKISAPNTRCTGQERATSPESSLSNPAHSPAREGEQ